jgi:hypothetical protein
MRRTRDAGVHVAACAACRPRLMVGAGANARHRSLLRAEPRWQSGPA